MFDVAHIETDRLILRRPCIDDAAAFFEIHGDPETNLFNPAGAMTAERARDAIASDMAHWSRRAHGYWAICRRDEPDLVIGFGGIAWRVFGTTERANLGFRFAASTWGQGYATELARAALDVGWHQLELDAVWASARENHAASLRILEKIGMTRVERVVDTREGVAASMWYVIQARQPR